MQYTNQNINQNQLLRSFCKKLTTEFAQISTDRKNLLEQLGAYIAKKTALEQDIFLNVICTHNSRRSHIGQLWLQAAAQYYGIPKVKTYSGGTGATAFNKNAIAAMQRAGFEIITESTGNNPTYRANIALSIPISKVLFSKRFDSPANPQKDFAVIMVCSEADAGCPFVPGADGRFAIPFVDPKAGDGTPQEQEKYDACVQQIGREFLYVVYYATTLVQQNK